MSKPRPPHGAAAPSIGQITPESSRLDIIGEKIRVRTEILRRQDYKELMALRAELEALPPLPASHDGAANED